MELLPKDRQIYVSGRIWHEMYPKANPGPFDYVFFRNIDLTEYGDGLEKYYFTFIIMPTENNLYNTGTYINKKKKTAEIAVRIPYEKIFHADHEETLKLLEAAYLEGIELIKHLPIKGSFDADDFKKDVEAIFSNPDWYDDIATEIKNANYEDLPQFL